MQWERLQASRRLQLQSLSIDIGINPDQHGEPLQDVGYNTCSVAAVQGACLDGQNVQQSQLPPPPLMEQQLLATAVELGLPLGGRSHNMDYNPSRWP